MRWNCPHCGTALSLNTKKEAPAWSFARCYQCHGFALVRKNEPQRPIKVGPREATLPPPPNAAMRNAQATPPGSGATGPALLGKKALQNWNAHQERQGVKQAAENLLTAQASRIPPRFRPKKATTEKVAQAWGETWNEALRIPLSDIAAALPEPLPEVPERSPRQRFTPYLAVAAGAFLMLSGASLLIKSERLWQRPVSSSQAAPQRKEVLQVETSLIDRAPAERARNPQDTVAPVVPPAVVQQSAPTREEATDAYQPRVIGLQLRAGPGTNYRTLGRASPAERFQVVGQRGEWNRIQLDGSRPEVPFAWVRRDLIERSR